MKIFLRGCGCRVMGRERKREMCFLGVGVGLLYVWFVQVCCYGCGSAIWRGIWRCLIEVKLKLWMGIAVGESGV